MGTYIFWLFLSNKQMIKIPTGTIPDIAGLKEAINQKWSNVTTPDDSKIPQIYALSEPDNNAPTETISRKENEVKQMAVLFLPRSRVPCFLIITWGDPDKFLEIPAECDKIVVSAKRTDSRNFISLF